MSEVEIEDNELNNESDELFEHFRFEVDPGQSLLRVDKFLFSKIQNASRNKIQNAASAGCVIVNDKPRKSNYKVKPGDIISVMMPHPKRDTEIIPQDIPLNIVYEDDEVLIINKQSGLVVHPGHGNPDGTLVNALAFYFNDKLLESEDGRPGLVHRIDKDTSGIMVIAKTEHALQHLGKQFYEHTSERTYQAIIWGEMDEPEGTITGHIGRHLKERIKMDVFPDGEYGKHAVTHYKTIESFQYVSLIECKLETGRSHQIRAHLTFTKHPLFNDSVYGGNMILKGTTFSKYKQFVQNCFNVLPRQALHAKSLAFDHPRTGERMFFESELPSDMQEAINKWRGYINSQFS